MSSVPNVIHFNCQSCGMLLTVPAEYAGVTGPCPHCRVTITSPAATPPASALPGPSWPQAQNAASPPQAPPAPPIPAAAERPQTALPGSRVLTSLPQPASAPAAAPSSPRSAWEASNPSQAGTTLPPAMGGTTPDTSWSPNGTDLLASSGAGSSSHPVMDSVLQMPPVHAAQASPSPAFPPAPPPRTSTLASPVAVAPSQRFKSSHSTGSSGRKGPALLALLMAMMVLAGTAWFFRDQIRVAWLTHMVADDAESDALEFHPTPTEPEAPANFDPAQPPKPSKTESPSVVETQPAPAPVNGAGTGSAPTTGTPDSSLPEQVQRPAMAATPDASPAPGFAPAPATPGTQTPKTAPNLVEVPSPMPPTPEPPPATGAASPKAVPAPAPAPVIADVPEESRPALDALQQFLTASTWEERLKVVQGADLMRPLMQSYYASMPDGPLAVTKIALIRHDKAPQTGPPHCVFQIGGGEVKRPLPIMVEQSPDGWKVDWLTFTEFKDNLLARFMESHQEGPKRFHVLVRRTHYFDDNVPEMDKKICVEVQSPTPPFVGSVFARRGTPVANILDRYLGWEVDQAAAVVELEWRREGDQQWVELTGLPQFNWRNAMAGEVIPPPQAAPTAPVAVPARD